jgi:hypothetical protein
MKAKILYVAHITSKDGNTPVTFGSTIFHLLEEENISEEFIRGYLENEIRKLHHCQVVTILNFQA